MWFKKKEERPIFVSMVDKQLVFSFDGFEGTETEKIGETLNSPHFEDVIYPPEVEEAMKLILEHLKLKDFNLLFVSSIKILIDG